MFHKKDRTTKKPFFTLRTNQPRKQINRIIAWLLVAGWMTVIFILSHQPAAVSASLSSGITQRLIELTNQILQVNSDVHAVHFFLRKGAHFTSYMILGILTYFAMWHELRFHSKTLASYSVKHSRFMDRILDQKNKHYIKKMQFILCLVLTLVICVLYAISDEVHQLFIPGRSGEIRDVLIDSAGAVTGICIMAIYHLLQNKRT